MTNSSEIKFGDIVMPHYQGVYGSTHRLTLDWCVRGVLPDGRRFALIVREGFTFDGASNLRTSARGAARRGGACA